MKVVSAITTRLTNLEYPELIPRETLVTANRIFRECSKQKLNIGLTKRRIEKYIKRKRVLGVLEEFILIFSLLISFSIPVHPSKWFPLRIPNQFL